MTDWSPFVDLASYIIQGLLTIARDNGKKIGKKACLLMLARRQNGVIALWLILDSTRV